VGSTATELGPLPAVKGEPVAVSIRQRGKTRGRRLFDVASIRAFLNASVDKQGDAK